MRPAIADSVKGARPKTRLFEPSTMRIQPETRLRRQRESGGSLDRARQRRAPVCPARRSSRRKAPAEPIQNTDVSGQSRNLPTLIPMLCPSALNQVPKRPTVEVLGACKPPRSQNRHDGGAGCNCSRSVLNHQGIPLAGSCPLENRL